MTLKEKASDFYQKQVVLHPEPGSFTSQDSSSSRWSSKELDPVPFTKRSWHWYHIGGFWIAEGFSAAQMEAASGAVTLGLNPGLAIVACLVGNLLVLTPCVLNGYVGAKYGLNFPVFARASFGMRGSYLAMVIRGVVCVIWYGVQANLGGLAVQAMITAIWPSFATWRPDALPESASITAQGLLCFSIFWIISLPMLFLNMHHLRYLLLLKVFIVPLFYVAVITWAITAAHGTGQMFSQPTNIIGGYSAAFAFFRCVTSAISGNATFAINMPDMTRFAISKKGAVWSQVVLLPICLTMTEILGVIMASASGVIYGEVQWNPLLVVLNWTESRAGMFFGGFVFALANITTNITGNSIPFGNDLMGLFPKYISLRRGQIICAVLGFAITPWNIEAKAERFLAFLNGYSVFLGPLCGILLVDYWLVRTNRRGIVLDQLYKIKGIYSYWHGVNLRAIGALVCGVVPLVPGLAQAINNSNASQGIQNLYTMSWLVGLVFAGVVYYGVSYFFPFQMEIDGEDIGLEYLKTGEIQLQGTGYDSETQEENVVLEEKV